MINNKNQCDNTFHCQSYGKITKCNVAIPKGNGSKYCKFATVSDLIIICSNPLARKNPDQINIFNPKKGNKGWICNSCHANKKRHKRKDKMLDYKGGRCIICGYNKCKQALSFHHINPEEKDFEIAGSHCRAWEKVQKELDKCILVCANCHHEIHEKEMGL